VTMSTLKLHEAAYCKLLLHCAKYPWSNVFGLLLCDASDSAEIVDAIPVFHAPILSPVLEVAVALATQHCTAKNLRICGGYYCGEDSAVAEKAVSQICAKGKGVPLLVVVEKDKLSKEDMPFKLVGSDLLKKTKIQAASPSCAKSFLRLLKEKRESNLVDFEDTLENVSLDFRNQTLLS
jgi:hypothetical protein